MSLNDNSEKLDLDEDVKDWFALYGGLDLKGEKVLKWVTEEGKLRRSSEVEKVGLEAGLKLSFLNVAFVIPR